MSAERWTGRPTLRPERTSKRLRCPWHARGTPWSIGTRQRRGAGCAAPLTVLVWVGAFVLPGAVGLADELRDPFTFGTRSRFGAASPSVLLGVLWDTARPFAIVGGDTVAAGDQVGEWMVVEIKQDGIVIERYGRRTFIKPGHAFPNE